MGVPSSHVCAAPIFFCLCTVGFIGSGIALTANMQSGTQPQPVMAIGAMSCVVITIQSTHKLALLASWRSSACLEGEGGAPLPLDTPATTTTEAPPWVAMPWVEPWVRAASPVASALLVYSTTYLVHRRRLTPWAAYRTVTGVAAVVMLASCFALRVCIGAQAKHPPGDLPFVAAVVCWLELLLASLVCTPRMRQRCLEAWTVISLEEGVVLRAADEAIDEIAADAASSSSRDSCSSPHGRSSSAASEGSRRRECTLGGRRRRNSSARSSPRCVVK